MLHLADVRVDLYKMFLFIKQVLLCSISFDSSRHDEANGVSHMLIRPTYAMLQQYMDNLCFV